MFILITCIFLSSCTKDQIVGNLTNLQHQQNLTADVGVAIDWYKLQLRFLRERNSTLNSSDIGYIGIGLYESIRNGIPNAQSFSSKLNQMPAMPASDKNNLYIWQVSANAAMAALLRSYNTGLTTANKASIDSLEKLNNQKFTLLAGLPTFTRSQLYGRAVAAAVRKWSLTDGYNGSNAGYVPPVFAGSWVPTPPAFANGIFPYVSNARPLIAANATIKAPFPLFSYSEFTISDYYKMMKIVYQKSKNLTTDEKNIALFWNDQGNEVSYTPAGHHIAIIILALQKVKADLWLAAETFAKAGIAEREAFIVCFRAKYTYNTLRPITYIRKFIDPNWLSFIPTPPHPEYPAAHALITGSVMQAATKVLGENLAFTDNTFLYRGFAARNYSSLINAAEEAGNSRLYGGIHCQPSIDAGLALGIQVGNTAGNIKLR